VIAHGGGWLDERIPVAIGRKAVAEKGTKGGRQCLILNHLIGSRLVLKTP